MSPVTDQQYADLLQRVEALEGTQVDQLVPSVFSLNAAGELEEELSGKLTAKGIIFSLGNLVNATEGKPSQLATSEILWQREGVTGAAIAAYKYKAKSPSVLKGLILSLTAVNQTTANMEAKVIAEALEESGGARARVSAGAQLRTLIDNLGNSSFPVIRNALGELENAPWRIVIGVAALEWSGGTSESKTKTQTTGLNPESQWIYLCQAIPNGLFDYHVLASGQVTISVTGIAATVPAAGSKAEVWYMGIGF